MSNYHQLLLDVSLPTLLNRYINKHLHHNHNVWPIKDICKAIALFWHMAVQSLWVVIPYIPFGESAPLPLSDTLNREPLDSHERMMDVMAFAWF